MNSYVLKEYQMKRKMEDFALSSGYLPYEPTLFESYDHFSMLSGDVKKEQLVTVINGQKFQLLRPDITTTIMNNVLPYIPEGQCVKLFYQSTVYRASSSGIKAIDQFGIEYLGLTNWPCERDILSLAISYLQDVPFVLEVGTTAFLNQLIDLCELGAEQEKIFRKLVYIKNREELVKFGKVNQIPNDVQLILAELFTLRGTYTEVLMKLKSLPLGSTLSMTLNEVDYLKAFEDQVVFDLSMNNERAYYDGIIFKGYYRHVSKAVLSGGRYAGNAIGFSIDVDKWMKGQKEESAIWTI